MTELPKPVAAEQEENMIAVLREDIDGAAEGITREHERMPAHDWLSCFRTRIATLEANLGLPTTMSQLGDAAYQKARKKLDDLKQRVRELPSVPTKTVQQKLIEQLDILRP